MTVGKNRGRRGWLTKDLKENFPERESVAEGLPPDAQPQSQRHLPSGRAAGQAFRALFIEVKIQKHGLKKEPGDSVMPQTQHSKWASANDLCRCRWEPAPFHWVCSFIGLRLKTSLAYGYIKV